MYGLQNNKQACKLGQGKELSCRTKGAHRVNGAIRGLIRAIQRYSSLRIRIVDSSHRSSMYSLPLILHLSNVASHEGRSLLSRIFPWFPIPILPLRVIFLSVLPSLSAGLFSQLPSSQTFLHLAFKALLSKSNVDTQRASACFAIVPLLLFPGCA